MENYVLEHNIDQIGGRVKWIRNNLKESQDVFCSRLNTSKPTLGKYESGKETPRYDELISLINSVKNLNPAWLFMNKGEPFKEMEVSDKADLINSLLRQLEDLRGDKNYYKLKVEKLENHLEQYDDKTVKKEASSQ